MRITSIDKLMSNTDDRELLDIYVELESGKVPSTSYAHDFCRKVNRMIDAGEISVKQDGFRHIYLPSLRKLTYREMARRYASYLMCHKAPEANDTTDDEEDLRKCDWCNCEFEESDLRETDIGMLCDRCIAAIRSRGEPVMIIE